MARVYTREPATHVDRARLLPPRSARDAAKEQDWKSYAQDGARLQRRSSAACCTRIQRLQGHLFLNPDHLKGVAAAHRAEHDRQLHHEHELAVLRRRVHDVVPDADGRARGAELRLGRRSAWRCSPRSCAASRAARRRRSATSGATSTARSSTSCCRSRSSLAVDPHLAGRAADASTRTRPRRRCRARTRRSRAARSRSQIAIKQLGTNGGGYYNSNSAVPFENPTGLTNFLEMLSILLIPAAQVFMFGRMVLARRHALGGVRVDVRRLRDRRRHQPAGGAARLAGAPQLRREHHAGGTASPAATCPTRRFASGRPTPPLWTVATTDASNGSVNGGHDAQTPAGGAVPLVNIFLGEVIFGGVGSGLYGMFFYILIAVFVAGLMVGRTPEWLGKKIEAREIKLAALGALFVPTMVLDDDGGRDRDASPGSRRSTTPARTASPRRSTPTLAVEQQRQRVRRLRRDELLRRRSARSRCYFGRFVPLLAALALGGSLAKKKIVPASAGTFRTDGADLRRPARRRHRAHRRADDLPGAHARADRRRADALMRANSLALGRRDRRAHRRASASAIRALMTGFASVAFPHQANGSLIKRRRQGRRLEARGAGVHVAAVLPRAPVGDVAGLQRRRRRRSRTSARRARLWRRTCRRAPRRSSSSKARTTRASRSTTSRSTRSRPPRSGIDPDISPAYAALQAHRVAAVRHLPLATVQKLIKQNTDGRSLGFFGEPGVNVLELNLALDKLGGK